ncbi:MAG: hypothetical protein LLG37_08735 [Spirochaetia bacterium]|nr:hypothetical protein [Spirochaetia bacterium]
MNKHQFLKYIERLNEFKFDFTLDRVKCVLKLLGNPQDSFSVIHVTGSNGKGSVTWYLSNILKAHNIKTGTYTSPHLKDVRERIAVNGRLVEWKTLLKCCNRLARLMKRHGIRLTYFEFLTVAAFMVFKEAGVETAVVEAGLGGRLDATNAGYASKLLSIITSISLEHTDWLGNTELAILKEKAAIIGKGKAVVNVSQKPLIKYLNARFGNRVVFPDRAAPVLSVKAGRQGTTVQFKDGVYASCMPEPVQARNISTVLTALAVLEAEGLKFEPATVKKAIYETSLQGRMSRSRKGYYLSVAHNPEAFGGALAAIKTLAGHKGAVVVFSLLKDKNAQAILKQAAGIKHLKFVFTSINNERAIDIEILKRYGVKYKLSFYTEPDNEAAMKLANRLKGRGIVVVGGSFYLVKKFL